MTEQKETISGKIEEYLNKIITEDEANKFRIGSSAVYTELSAGEILPVTLRSQDKEKQQPREFEVFELVESEKNIIISGDSGSGKTTTLRWLNVIYSRKHLNDKKYSIPLYVDLNTYNKGEFSDYLKIKAKENGLDESTLKSLLESKENLLILIDGLDLPTPLDKFNPNDEILNFISDYSHCKFVISSRSGFFKAFESRFKIFKLEELTDDKIALFIKKYVGDEEADDIKEILLSDGKFKSLFKNPLMLFLGIKVAKDLKDNKTELDKDVFLSSRSKLYDGFISYLIHHHFKSKGKTLHCDEVYIQEAVTEIFFNLQCKNRIVCKYSQALKIANNYSEGCEKKKSEYILHDIFKIGLLKKKDDTIQFGIHQSFQEYFAAKKLVKLFKDGVDISSTFSHPRWENVVVFASDMLEQPDELIFQLIEKAKEKGLSPPTFLSGLRELGLASECATNANLEIKEELCALLTNGLDSKFKLDKFQAFEAITMFGNVGISIVTRFLSDPDALMRALATRSLGRIGSDSAIPSLVSLLSDPDISVKINASHSLGEIGSDSAIPSLVSLLSDPDPMVAFFASFSLDEIGSDSVVSSLVPLLSNPDIYVHILASLTLGKIGSDSAVSSLLSLLSDPDPSVKASVCAALGKIGSDSAVPPLISLLSDPDPSVKASVCAALGKIGSDSAVPPLISLLSDPDPSVKASVCAALGKIGSDSAVPPLISLLSDPDPSVKASVCAALGKIGSDSAVPPLISLLSDPDPSVKVSVCAALGKIGSDSAASALLDSLSNVYFGVRMSACAALGEIGSVSAVSALLDSLSDTYFGVRIKAVSALGEIGSVSALSSLYPFLSDPNASLRMSAASALGKIGSASVGSPLLHLLSDSDASVRAMAASAFYDIGSDSAVSALLDSLYDSNAKVREKASFALKKICKIKHKDLLLKLTKSDHEDAVNSGYEILKKIEMDELSEQELFREIQKIPEKTTSSSKHGFPDAHSPEDGKTDAYMGILVDKLKSISEPITLVDYGCGKGKLLSAMEGLPQHVRKYISYIGVDVRAEYLYRTELFARKKGYYDSLKTIPEFLNPDMFNSKDFLVDYVFVVHTLHEIELVNLIDVIYHISDKLNAGGQIFVLDQRQLIEPEGNYTLWDSNDFETLYSDSGFKVSSMARDTKTEKKLVSVEIEKVEDNCFSIEKVKENCLSVYESKQDTILKQINLVEHGCTEYNSFCEQYTILGGQIKKVRDLNIR